MCHVAMIFSIKGFHFNFILAPIYGNWDFQANSNNIKVFIFPGNFHCIVRDVYSQ